MGLLCGIIQETLAPMTELFHVHSPITVCLHRTFSNGDSGGSVCNVALMTLVALASKAITTAIVSVNACYVSAVLEVLQGSPLLLTVSLRGWLFHLQMRK